MFKIFYSEDRGLLDKRASEFKNKFANVRTIKAPALSDLEFLFCQQSLLEETNNYLVEDYSDSLEDLASLLTSLKDSDYKILFLFNKKELYINEKLETFFADKIFKLDKLNNTTKKRYIGDFIEERGIKIEKELLKYIKTSLPPIASVINDFVDKLAILNPASITTDLLEDLLKDHRREVNFFSFLEIYLKDDLNWVIFINFHLISVENLRKFLYSFSYKILEFKRFLILRSEIQEIKKIATSLRVESYVLRVYESLWNTYGDQITRWLNIFIIDLYSLHSKLTFSYTISVEFLKYFLIKKKELLLSCQTNTRSSIAYS